MKAVFDTKPNSGYDDQVDRYHFPANRAYLAVAVQAVQRAFVSGNYTKNIKFS